MPPLRSSRSSFVRRFLRGEYSLAFSYCAIGLSVYLTIGLLLAGVSFTMRQQAFNPHEVVAVAVVIWAAIIAGQIFQSLGVWRSAARHRRLAAIRGTLGLWGIAAQGLVILGGAGLGYVFAVQGVPQLRESWRMAFEGDPDIPPYTMRLMRGGREAEITGGFKFGLSRDAAKLFAGAPHLEVVHLNSGGGRLGEAVELAKLIRKYRLSTYTSASCASACTIAFVAGRERFLKKGATIGFHRAIFAGVEQTSEMRTLLRAANVDSAFVERAMAQPSVSIWYPTLQELTAANVAMAVVDAGRFAASGLGPDPSLHDFKVVLEHMPVFAAMKAVDEPTFDDSAELYRQGYRQGKPDSVIMDEIGIRELAPLVRTRLESASGELVIDYARLMADQLAFLDARDADACFAYATRPDAAAAMLLPPALRQREEALSLMLLRSGSAHQPPSAAEKKEAAHDFFNAISSRYGADNAHLLTNPAKATQADRASLCKLSTEMFRTIADLPPAQARMQMSGVIGVMTEATPIK